MKLNRHFLKIMLLLSTIFIVGCGEPSITVINLSCEDLENPQGIDVKNPRMSWQLESNKRGQKQTAYRLLVSSSHEKLAKD